MEAEMCIDCKTEEATSGERCRDCDITHLHETWPRCAECNVRLYSDVGHRLGCAEAHADGCKSGAEKEAKRCAICKSSDGRHHLDGAVHYARHTRTDCKIDTNHDRVTGKRGDVTCPTCKAAIEAMPKVHASDEPEAPSLF